MTDREKAIVMAFTGKCMLTEDKFKIFHKYVEEIMGRPVFTHELGLLANNIKEKSKADFIKLCQDQEEDKQGEWVTTLELFDDEEYPRRVWSCSRCGFSYKFIHDRESYCTRCGSYNGYAPSRIPEEEAKNETNN